MQACTKKNWLIAIMILAILIFMGAIVAFIEGVLTQNEEHIRYAFVGPVVGVIFGACIALLTNDLEKECNVQRRKDYAELHSEEVKSGKLLILRDEDMPPPLQREH